MGVIGSASIRVDLSRDLVRKALATVGAAFVGEKLEAALAAGALLVANDAKHRAPIISGTLRRSIHIGGHTDLPTKSDQFRTDEGYDDIRGNGASAQQAWVLVGTDLVYAPRIEFGFVGQDSLGRSYHQAAQPYLRPAFDENLPHVELAVRRSLDKLLAAALA